MSVSSESYKDKYKDAVSVMLFCPVNTQYVSIGYACLMQCPERKRKNCREFHKEAESKIIDKPIKKMLTEEGREAYKQIQISNSKSGKGGGKGGKEKKPSSKTLILDMLESGKKEKAIIKEVRDFIMKDKGYSKEEAKKKARRRYKAVLRKNKPSKEVVAIKNKKKAKVSSGKSFIDSSEEKPKKKKKKKATKKKVTKKVTKKKTKKSKKSKSFLK